MKKILSLFLTLSLSPLGWTQTANKADYDSTKGQYKIEEGARIVIAVDSEAWGHSLVDLWNAAHPEATDVVSFVSLPSQPAVRKMAFAEHGPDVVVASLTDVLPSADHLAAIDGNLVKLANDNVAHQLYKVANASFRGIAALPIAYDGLVFAWNKTMLTALGYDVREVTPSNLPVNFDTWEKILALASDWQSKRPVYLGQSVNIVFPLSVDDLWAGYSILTVGGWQIFQEVDPAKPGFEKPEFLRGLEFLKAAADAKIAVQSDGSLAPAPFALVATELDADGADTQKTQDLQFSAMPTWKGIRPTPLLQVKVAVVSSTTSFPSAASELLRLIFTKDGMQSLVDHSPYVPTLMSEAKIAPDFSAHQAKLQILTALAYSNSDSISLWQSGAGQPALGVLQDNDLTQAAKDVWNGTKTPVEAQKAIVAASDRWYNENSGH